MPSSWPGQAYRKLFFDYHNHSTALGVAAAFDAPRWADQLVAAQVQAVSVCAKCMYGWSYYQKGSHRYVHPRLPAGLDMVEEQVQTLRERNIRAIGYYHTFGSEPVAKAHPDWLIVDKDGKSDLPNAVCLMSPVAEECLLPQIAELASLYELDALFFDGTATPGLCYCPHCRRKFEAATGLKLPRDKDEPAWPAHVRWRFESLRELRHRMCCSIHQARPEIIVSFNWAHTLELPEPIPEDVGALALDIRPQNQPFLGSLQAKHWSLSGKPFDIMNTAFLQWWGDWGCKPAIAMQQESATIIANGGCVWIGYQMTPAFEVQPAVMRELAETLRFIKEREPYLADAYPIPVAAVLVSSAGLFTDDCRPEALSLNPEGQFGAHKLLMETAWPCNFVDETRLLKHIDEFKVVILNDQRYLSAGLANALQTFVRNGGLLIATGLTGTLDDSFKPRGGFILEDLLGVAYHGVYEKTIAYIDVGDLRLKKGALDMPHMIEAQIVFARPLSAKTLVLARLLKPALRSDGKHLLSSSPVGEDSGFPAITLKKSGKGAAVYMAGNVFNAYQKRNQWNLKHIVANLLDFLVADKPVELKAPLWLEVALNRQGARTLIHLVNHHSTAPLPGHNVCAEQIPAVGPVTVRLRRDRKPGRVMLAPENTTLEWSFDGRRLEVIVPRVFIHSIIVVE